MFGKADFTIKTLLILCALMAALAESNRQKKDVHHMIFLNESRKPPKSHRHKNHDHHNYHTEDRPKKSVKKTMGKKPAESISLEVSIEESSNEQLERYKPKPKGHHHKQTYYPSRHYKRHNHQTHHHNDYKKYHKDDHQHNHNHAKYIPKDSHKFATTKWIPMSSQELFGKEEHQFPVVPPQGYVQSAPMEITTPLPFQPLSTYYFQSTIYPPLLSSYNQHLNEQTTQKGPQIPLIGTVEPYKPFDYSILEQESQNINPSDTYQSPIISSSNIVNVKHKGGKNGSPLSIVVEHSRENIDNQENKEREKETKKEGEGEKYEENTRKRNKNRASSRYRIKRKQ